MTDFGWLSGYTEQRKKTRFFIFMPSDSPPDNANPSGAQSSGDTQSARGLLRATSVVSSMTLVSRILGLARDIVFARFFGAGIVMDAFVIANRIPNMLRRFFAEGAFSQGFVPVMARYREQHQHQDARQFVDAVAGTLGLILFGITLVGVVAAPLLVLIVAPGFVGEDGRFDLATTMLRFTFPYLLFVSLTAFAGGVLNTYGRFAVPAFTPVILNIVLIAFAMWLSPLLDEPGMALAYGVFVAGVIQLLFQIPFLSKIDAIPRPRWRPQHDGVKRVVKLMLPAIFGSSVAQINVLLGGIIASLLGPGKVSLLYYSDRLMEFPLGMFGIALATVTLPHLSRQAANKSMRDFSNTLDWSMKLVVLIAVPASIGLIMLAEPLMATIYYGGVFDETHVELAAVSLQTFAVGLIGFSFVKILAPAYFAREDTRTPVKVGLIALVVNFSLSVIFAYYLTKIGFAASHAGLALAISIAALLNAWLLYRGLYRGNVIQHAKDWSPMLVQFLVANVAMAMCLYFMQRPLEWWLDASVLQRSIWLGIVVIAAAAVYFLALFVAGMRSSHFRHEQG